MRIALTGATGFVGTEVLNQALEARFTVNALTRRPQPMRRGVRWIQGSLEQAQGLDMLMAGADAVIHVAGLTAGRTRAEFDACNVGGTRAMVDAARRAGVRRFIHVSSLAAREPGLSDYGWSKMKAEQIVMSSGLEWTIVRPPAIYGPGDTEMLEMFRMARRGFLPLPSKGKMSVIHVEDLARLLVALPRVAGDHVAAVYEVDDGMPNGWTQKALARAIGWAVGGRVRTLTIPGPVLWLAARLDIWLRRGKAKLTPDRARYFQHPDWTIDPTKRPLRSFWKPKLGTEMGMKAVAAAYRNKGWLKR